MTKPNLKISALAPLVGTWNTTGEVLAAVDAPAAKILATDRYEYFPGGHFLLHHVDARLGDTVTRSLEIFAGDRSAKVVIGRSHDDLGRIELSTISLRNGSIKITGDAIRFSGNFSQDKRVITGRWQRKTDAGAWVRFMNVTLARAA